MLSSVTFERGLALLDNFKSAYSLIYEERDVELKSFESVKAGYVYACHQYVRRWVDGGHAQQVPLPRLEELLEAGGVYLNPLSQCIYPVCRVGLSGEPQRFFSVVAPFVCAYVDSLNNLFSVIFQYNLQYVHVKEFISPMEAKNYTVYDYTVEHMSFGAYLADIIHLPSNLRLNEVFYDERGMMLPRGAETIGVLKEFENKGNFNCIL